MTKQQILEYFGRSVYQIWLELAMKHFDARDPDAAFVTAKAFIDELLVTELPIDEKKL